MQKTIISDISGYSMKTHIQNRYVVLLIFHISATTWPILNKFEANYNIPLKSFESIAELNWVKSVYELFYNYGGGYLHMYYDFNFLRLITTSFNYCMVARKVGVKNF